MSGGDDKTIKEWNLSTGQVIHTLTGRTDAVMSVAYSPDGQRALSGSYQEIKEWNLSTGQEIRTLTVHTRSRWVRSVAYSPDGQTALSGECNE